MARLLAVAQHALTLALLLLTLAVGEHRSAAVDGTSGTPTQVFPITLGTVLPTSTCVPGMPSDMLRAAQLLLKGSLSLGFVATGRMLHPCATMCNHAR